jgi:hypothetical protein
MTVEHKQAASIVQVNVAAEQLTGRWLIVARIIWAFIALLALGLLVPTYASQPAYLHTLCTGTVATCGNSLKVTPGDLRAFQTLGLSLDFFVAYNFSIAVVIAVVYITVGAVIFWRKSDDRMAFFASVTLLTFPAAFSYRLLAILPAVLTLPSHFLVFLGNISLFLFFGAAAASASSSANTRLVNLVREQQQARRTYTPWPSHLLVWYPSPNAPACCDQAVGLIFWLRLKRFPGSNCFLISASRS